VAADQGAGNEPMPEAERAALVAVQALDPSIDAASLRRYLREIAEAEAALSGIELDDVVPVASFSPEWNPEATR
jgi:hypothetical protein